MKMEQKKYRSLSLCSHYSVSGQEQMCFAPFFGFAFTIPTPRMELNEKAGYGYLQQHTHYSVVRQKWISFVPFLTLHSYTISP